MSFADSKPVFKDRAIAAGLSEQIIQNLVDEKLDTLSKFAFASAYVPGSGDDSEFIKTLKTVIKRDPALGELASFRKLLHEAYSLVTAEMKQQLERSEDFQARKLTQPERADLYERQVKRITGLTLKGPLEPSDALIDVFCAIYESNRLRWVPWEKYTAKEAELDKETKTEHLFAVDSSGKLKVENKRSDPIADTSTEILLQYALQRRGLSMDQANLLDFKTHQLWVDRLIKVRLQVPPPGYSKTTFRQLLEADKKLFEELADETRHGIQSTTKGRPLDNIFETCMNKAEVMHLLQPLMGKSHETKSDERPSSNKVAPYRPPSTPKGKGKGKSKSKSSPKMPHVLVNGGCRATTNAGDAICYGFNLGDQAVCHAPQNAVAVSSSSHEGDIQESFTEAGIDSTPPRLLREAPLFIEACCGSALLSACASKAGFDTLAIDFHGNKHRPFVHVVELDLRKTVHMGLSGTFGGNSNSFPFSCSATLRYCFKSQRRAFGP
eukprot:s441_g21.t1